MFDNQTTQIFKENSVLKLFKENVKFITVSCT